MEKTISAASAPPPITEASPPSNEAQPEPPIGIRSPSDHATPRLRFSRDLLLGLGAVALATGALFEAIAALIDFVNSLHSGNFAGISVGDGVRAFGDFVQIGAFVTVAVSFFGRAVRRGRLLWIASMLIVFWATTSIVATAGATFDAIAHHAFYTFFLGSTASGISIALSFSALLATVGLLGAAGLGAIGFASGSSVGGEVELGGPPINRRAERDRWLARAAIGLAAYFGLLLITLALTVIYQSAIHAPSGVSVGVGIEAAANLVLAGGAMICSTAFRRSSKYHGTMDAELVHRDGALATGAAVFAGGFLVVWLGNLVVVASASSGSGWMTFFQSLCYALALVCGAFAFYRSRRRLLLGDVTTLRIDEHVPFK